MDQTSLLGTYPEPGEGEDAWVIYLQPRRSMSRTFREGALPAPRASAQLFFGPCRVIPNRHLLNERISVSFRGAVLLGQKYSKRGGPEPFRRCLTENHTEYGVLGLDIFVWVGRRWIQGEDRVVELVIVM